MTLEEEDSPRKAQRSVHSGKPICLLEFSVVFTAECAYLFLGDFRIKSHFCKLKI